MYGIFYLIGLIVVAIAVKWVLNGFYLPKVWRYLCMAALAIVVVAAFVISIIFAVNDKGTTGMVWLSLSYAGIVIALLVVAISKLAQRASHNNRRYYAHSVPQPQPQPHHLRSPCSVGSH